MRLPLVQRAALAAAAAVAVVPLSLLVPQLAAGDQAPCCFTNPRYSGVCQVVPGEGESCASILAYLNNQSSVGKSYCGTTTIRGGWAQVDCEQTSVVTDQPFEGPGH
jgi:hypothetical protein